MISTAMYNLRIISKCTDKAINFNNNDKYIIVSQIIIPVHVEHFLTLVNVLRNKELSSRYKFVITATLNIDVF